jgi:DASH complex subunit DAD2
MAGSQQQSPVLLARIAEKKAELANLKDLQALSGGLADQMQMLTDKLATLSDGTEGTSRALHTSSWTHESCSLRRRNIMLT